MCHAGPTMMDRSWRRVLTKCGPLEKGMANHFSILALRTPWTAWKDKKVGHWKMNFQGSWCPLCYWGHCITWEHQVAWFWAHCWISSIYQSFSTVTKNTPFYVLPYYLCSSIVMLITILFYGLLLLFIIHQTVLYSKAWIVSVVFPKFSTILDRELKNISRTVWMQV